MDFFFESLMLPRKIAAAGRIASRCSEGPWSPCWPYLVRARRRPRLTTHIRSGTGGWGRCADCEHQAGDEKRNYAARYPHDAHILFIFVIHR
jgi:hypothetical protein